MAETPETPTPLDAVAQVVDKLDAVEAISDPLERLEATGKAEKAIAAKIKGLRRGIAVELKREQKMTWRQIGELMGGVTAQRAEQISRGK